MEDVKKLRNARKGKRHMPYEMQVLQLNLNEVEKSIFDFSQN